MTGSLFWLKIECIAIHVGIGRNILSLDYDLYGDLIPWYWIKNLWNLSHEYAISLPTSPTQLGLHREVDLFLMEQFTHSGFTFIQLNKLNRCRLNLKIHTPHNISNGHVTYFDKRWYDGHQDEFHQATHSWNYQGYIGPKEWQLLHKALINCFLSDNNSTYLHKLIKWTDKCQKYCTCFYHQ